MTTIFEGSSVNNAAETMVEPKEADIEVEGGVRRGGVLSSQEL
jgi:hypothetical protein